jgi:hypothetical protein
MKQDSKFQFPSIFWIHNSHMTYIYIFQSEQNKDGNSKLIIL